MFQSSEPTYPTVIPAADFDPDKDAARIETAIKTKGEQKHYALSPCLSSSCERIYLEVITVFS